MTGCGDEPGLAPGAYSVTVEKSGFKKTVRSGIIVQVDQKARVDVALDVGQLSETVSVVAAAPLIRSESAELGEVIHEQIIRELPLNGRNFATLVYLAPGVTPGQVGENLSGASTFNPRGTSTFNALGSQGNSNAWLVDGIDNNEYTFNTVIVMPSPESVRESRCLPASSRRSLGGAPAWCRSRPSPAAMTCTARSSSTSATTSWTPATTTGIRGINVSRVTW